MGYCLLEIKIYNSNNNWCVQLYLLQAKFFLRLNQKLIYKGQLFARVSSPLFNTWEWILRTTYSHKFYHLATIEKATTR